MNRYTLSMAAAVLLLVGCAGLDNLLTKQEPVVSTDPTTGVVTTNYVMVPNPAIKSAIEFGGSLPVPWAGVAAGILGWAVTAYSAIRQKKTAVALVSGIEAGRKILQETPEGQKLDAKVKSALVEHQDIAGVLNEVSKLVNKYTA